MVPERFAVPPLSVAVSYTSPPVDTSGEGVVAIVGLLFGTFASDELAVSSCGETDKLFARASAAATADDATRPNPRRIARRRCLTATPLCSA